VRRALLLILFLVPCTLCLVPDIGYAANVTLAWDSNTEPDLAGYKIFYGTSSRNYSKSIDVGNVVEYTVADLQEGTTYYFAAKAYDYTDNESAYSDEIVHTIASSNHNPNTPSTPSGPSSGIVQTTYSYNTAGSDPDGDSLEYRFYWGDGGISEWGGAFSRTHSWSSAGNFCIKAQARDSHAATSDWSHCLNVSIGLNTHTIAASEGANGNISPSGTLTVNHGANQSFSMSPNQNYHVADVLVDGVSVGAVSAYTFENVIKDYTISAIFALDNQPPIADDDGDGVPNDEDAFPDDSSEWEDNDQDGIGNNADEDDDNDGLIDENEINLYQTDPINPDSDGDGYSDGEEISSGTDPLDFYSVPSPSTLRLEVGEISINDKWVRVSFNENFDDPIVVAKSFSQNNGDPGVIRIRNVDSSGFDIRIQEWDYLDGSHPTERAGYLAIERGTYTLPDGTRVEADRIETDSIKGFRPVLFIQSFRENPVVITSISSFNENDAVTGRIRNITTQDFEFCLQEQERNRKTHAVEIINYIAWEPSAGSLNGITFEVHKTERVITNKFHPIAFNQIFPNIPVFVADMQTANETDTSDIRWTEKTIRSIQAQIDEEQSQNKESKHRREVLGFMVFSY
jgi:hypothetical protein